MDPFSPLTIVTYLYKCYIILVIRLPSLHVLLQPAPIEDIHFPYYIYRAIVLHGPAAYLRSQFQVPGNFEISPMKITR